MDDLNYTIQTLHTLVYLSKPVLIVVGLLLLAIVYLVFTVHSKLDIVLKNQGIMQLEIDGIKKIAKGDSVDVDDSEVKRLLILSRSNSSYQANQAKEELKKLLDLEGGNENGK